MDSDEIRKRFIEFFIKRNHKLVSSSSLLPTDPSVLLTTAGMQQFKEYYTGKNALKDFGSKRLVSIQKCFRTSDINSVGDESHLTFFEMLGNFSFNDYFKEESIKWAYEFIKSLGVTDKRIHFSYFDGDSEIDEDRESYEVLKKLSVKIMGSGREDNFWGPTGLEGPCGPTVEIYVDNIEVWNLVFNEYYKDKDGKFSLLDNKGVDTGMGLERLTMVINNKKNVFDTDLFKNLIDNIKVGDLRIKRIIADHIRGSVFLISDKIRPSNVEHGYILRRLLRRIITYSKLYNIKDIESLFSTTFDFYKKYYMNLDKKEILKVFEEEKNKFEKSLDKGLRIFNKLEKISGKDAFLLYQSYGFPLELTRELAKERGLSIDDRAFLEEFRKHQEVSTKGAQKKFGGVGDYGEQVAKQHTATHLLHQALRDVLGNEVKQAGSDLTPERLRFDFTFNRKLTKEEKEKVERIVNEKINDNLKVTYEEMDYKDAVKSGALAFFKDKYPERVRVYNIGKYSKEICAGPHVRNTSEIGSFKILKEESSAAGVRRIKAIVD